jgi:hypothetical protein
MADTEAELCNLALGRVGVKIGISSLNEPSTEAAVAKLVYPMARDTALVSWPWQWATGRSQLAELAEDEQREGWTYAFARPTDCLKARYIWSGTRIQTEENLIPFREEMNNEGTELVILTDVTNPVLIYTRQVTNVSLFPPAFVNALAWLLAAEFVLSIPLKPELERFARERGIRAKDSAAADDANSQHEPQQKSSYELARR